MADLSQIETIIVVLMENRSFDHMLGYLSHPQYGNRPKVEGQRSDAGWLSKFTNEHNGERQAPFHTDRLDLNGDPPHERLNVRDQLGGDFSKGKPYPMTGFMKSYASNALVPKAAWREVMGFFTPNEAPITAFLADNYAICDHWFAPLPASTQPNRLMAMAGFTKIDNTRSDTVPNQDLVYDWCGKQKNRTVKWRVYHEGWPFFMVMNKWRLAIVEDAITGGGHFRSLNKLEEDLKTDRDFPQLVFIEPKYTDDHFSAALPSDDHAPTTISGGQAFLRQIYCALTTANPERWRRTVMIITYDENGGMFDQVSPPELKTAIVDNAGESFHTLGVRVPALVVSPLVRAGGVYNGVLDHTSILKLIGQVFGDRQYYSDEVNKRPLIGSVADVLADPDCRVDKIRDDRPQPLPFTPKDSFVKGRSYQPVAPNAEAFAYALRMMQQESNDHAAKKFPELASFLTARENLLWELARTQIHSKGCKLGDCERELRVFLEDEENKLVRDMSLAPVAYANLSEMINKMVAEARGGGSSVINSADFLTSLPQSRSLFDRTASLMRS